MPTLGQQDISSTNYKHGGAHCDFSCVEQSLPVTCTSTLKYSPMLYTIKHTTQGWTGTDSQDYYVTIMTLTNRKFYYISGKTSV